MISLAAGRHPSRSAERNAGDNRHGVRAGRNHLVCHAPEQFRACRAAATRAPLRAPSKSSTHNAAGHQPVPSRFAHIEILESFLRHPTVAASAALMRMMGWPGPEDVANPAFRRATYDIDGGQQLA